MSIKIRIFDDDIDSYRVLFDGSDIQVVSHEEPTEVILGQPGLVAAALPRVPIPTWVQSTWAGIDPLVQRARQLGITVTGLQGVFGPLIAEYVFARLLAEVRHTTHYAQAQRKRTWSADWPDTLRGQTICIFGTGSIGSEIARTAKHFFMHTRGISLRGCPNEWFDSMYQIPETPSALNGAHWIIAALPFTPDTKNLIDSKCFGLMARNATFINVGRSGTVDNDALVQCLVHGKLKQAQLDVFEEEPLPPHSHWWNIPNLTITPHISGVSYPADVVSVFKKNLRKFQAGETLQGLIDLERGY